MLPNQRAKFIIEISRDLENRYSMDELEIYFKSLEEHIVPSSLYGDKRAFILDTINSLSDVCLKILSQDFGYELNVDTEKILTPPENWKDTKFFKLFVSHISKDKKIATRLKTCLQSYAINCFVAHEDIEPTFEWQEEIERALLCMDAFLAVHTNGFSESNWTQQEIGFAKARDVKIISLKMQTEDPTGFISKIQALPRAQQDGEQVANEINKILSADKRTSEKLNLAKRELAYGKHGELWQ